MDIQFLLRVKGNIVHDTRADATIGECISKLAEKRIGALAVLDKSKKLAGIITERDVLNAMAARNGAIWDMPVSEVMTPVGRLVTGQLNDSVESVMRRMTDNRIRHLPVVENGQVLGMVSIGDVVKALLDQTLEENSQMKNYFLGATAQP